MEGARDVHGLGQAEIDLLLRPIWHLNHPAISTCLALAEERADRVGRSESAELLHQGTHIDWALFADHHGGLRGERSFVDHIRPAAVEVLHQRIFGHPLLVRLPLVLEPWVRTPYGLDGHGHTSSIGEQVHQTGSTTDRIVRGGIGQTSLGHREHLASVGEDLCLNFWKPSRRTSYAPTNSVTVKPLGQVEGSARFGHGDVAEVEAAARIMGSTT